MTYKVGEVFQHKNNPHLFATITSITPNLITVDWFSKPSNSTWKDFVYPIRDFEQHVSPLDTRSLEEKVKELLG
jgi:hypothetical protein